MPERVKVKYIFLYSIGKIETLIVLPYSYTLFLEIFQRVLWILRISNFNKKKKKISKKLHKKL